MKTSKFKVKGKFASGIITLAYLKNNQDQEQATTRMNKFLNNNFESMLFALLFLKI